jgi:hypothetical protein
VQEDNSTRPQAQIGMHAAQLQFMEKKKDVTNGHASLWNLPQVE